MTNELQALTERLEQVERQLTEIVTVLNEQSDPYRSAIARQFIVVDQEGRRRAELGTVIPAGQSDERPWLGLFDANDSIRACIGTGLGDDPEAAWVELYASDQAVAVNVTVDSNGPRFLMFGDAGRPSIAAHTSEGRPHITLFGADGEQKLNLTLSASGELRLSVEDANGERPLNLNLAGQTRPQPDPVQRVADPADANRGER